MLTPELLRSIFPDCKDPQGWTEALIPVTLRFEINTRARLASFLAQVGHESGSFNRLIENLRYKTSDRLMKVWPSRFPTAQAALPYVNNEEKLANFVYAGRNGNGDAASGDGFRYRGRGLIQVTGRANYRDAGVALGVDLVKQPELLLEPAHAAMSAGWFWSSRGLNALADDGAGDDDLKDFTLITRKINGGTAGIEERIAMLKAAERALA